MTMTTDTCQHELIKESEKCIHGFANGTTCEFCILQCPGCWDDFASSPTYGPRPIARNLAVRQHPDTHRWNVEETEHGMRVCKGDHPRADGCQWVDYIPTEKHFHLNARFHIEGGKLVKTSNGQPVPAEEPTFIIRGRDMLGVPIIAMYMQLAEREGCNEEFLAGVKESLDGFARFAFECAAKMKEPGVTRGK